MRTTHGRSFTHDIVQRLGQEIVCGVYGAQNPFPIEAELCKRLGVSRSVLREAVKMLTTKGLLNARPRQGTWVEPETNWNLLDPDVLRWFLERKFSPTLLLEFTQVRLAIEPMAASMAARLATDEAKAAIVAGLGRMKAAERGEDDPLESDIAFHVAILRGERQPFPDPDARPDRCRPAHLHPPDQSPQGGSPGQHRRPPEGLRRHPGRRRRRRQPGDARR